MNPIELLKKEHRDIERELLELETIMQDMDEEINYPNLIHVFKKLHNLWNEHEKKEEKLFNVLEKEQIKVPVEKMLFEHKLLSAHKKAMYNAIISGNEQEIKEALNKNCVVIIQKLREHINDEDEILYTITLNILTPKEIKELWASAK